MRWFVISLFRGCYSFKGYFAFMSLSSNVMNFLNENARREGSNQLSPDSDLFKLGVLDSFMLVDLISLLEEEYGICIPDADVNAANFHSIEAISEYLATHKG